jgi:hypothetical protein
MRQFVRPRSLALPLALSALACGSSGSTSSDASPADGGAVQTSDAAGPRTPRGRGSRFDPRT